MDGKEEAVLVKSNRKLNLISTPPDASHFSVAPG